MAKELVGTWLLQNIRFFRNGKQLGTWTEVGTAMFDTDGQFCLVVQYQGSDPNYPSEMLRFLGSAGTYQVDGNQIVTKTRCSSAEKRIGHTQEYEFTMSGNKMRLKSSVSDDSWFEGEWLRA